MKKEMQEPELILSDLKSAADIDCSGDAYFVPDMMDDKLIKVGY